VLLKIQNGWLRVARLFGLRSNTFAASGLASVLILVASVATFSVSELLNPMATAALIGICWSFCLLIWQVDSIAENQQSLVDILEHHQATLERHQATLGRVVEAMQQHQSNTAHELADQAKGWNEAAGALRSDLEALRRLLGVSPSSTTPTNPGHSAPDSTASPSAMESTPTLANLSALLDTLRNTSPRIWTAYTQRRNQTTPAAARSETTPDGSEPGPALTASDSSSSSAAHPSPSGES